MLKSKKWSFTSAVFIQIAFFITILFFPQAVRAESCASFSLSSRLSFTSPVRCSNIPSSVTVTVKSGSNQLLPNTTYTLMAARTYNANSGASINLATSQPTNATEINFSFTNSSVFEKGDWFLILHGTEVGIFPGGCSISGSTKTYTVSGEEWTAEVIASQNRDGKMCYGFPNGCLEQKIPITLEISNIKLCGTPYANKNINIYVEGAGINLHSTTNAAGTPTASPLTFTYNQPGIYHIAIGSETNGFDNVFKSNISISGTDGCTTCNTTKPKPIDPNQPYEYKICDQINGDLLTPEGGSAKDACLQCVGGNELGREGIWTAIGCIPRDPEKIVKSLLRLGLGMGGGFALIIILASGFVLSVSQGEPNRINEAKQWLTSALVGLLFIIFSVTLLHFIGYTIFKLPGFGGS